ncbi:ACT domain protein [Desulfocucumis palustris]|uniref:UPF0237 protein DCCM_4421 n=1 Tax=Desulfocucumis palustris TaxID=1898651 RepID=A0A2L2XGC7_9FIRM|nr:ACT domain-containing protein [Desulfocucumis palustris]GBF35298.1 ACT domain protein [Desulfocucumis palustris]
MQNLKQDSKGNRVIISVLGPDRVGIIAGVANILSENNINILDISQTIIQEFLAMVLIADMEKSKINMEQLKEKLAEKGREIGVKIDAQHEDVFNFMHRL